MKIVDNLIKIAITFSSVSMFCGFIYGFGGLTLVSIGYLDLSKFNIGIFMLLWIGPLAISIAIVGPYLIYKMWKS